MGAEYRLSGADEDLLVSLRHELHRHAELSGEEHHTKKLLMEFLRGRTEFAVTDCGAWFYAFRPSAMSPSAPPELLWMPARSGNRRIPRVPCRRVRVPGTALPPSINSFSYSGSPCFIILRALQRRARILFFSCEMFTSRCRLLLLRAP